MKQCDKIFLVFVMNSYQQLYFSIEVNKLLHWSGRIVLGLVVDPKSSHGGWTLSRRGHSGGKEFGREYEQRPFPLPRPSFCYHHFFQFMQKTTSSIWNLIQIRSVLHLHRLARRTDRHDQTIIHSRYELFAKRAIQSNDSGVLTLKISSALKRILWRSSKIHYRIVRAYWYLKGVVHAILFQQSYIVIREKTR